MDSTNNCYKFEKNMYTDGMFEECVDATYVIHLEGNGRYDSIQKQLREYHPTNTVYIVFNKGYKNCKKDDHIKLPAQDLTNAFLEIFKDAKIKNYNNILILEDDFMFNEKIKESFHQKNISVFLKDNENTDIQYLLGCIPYFKVPYIFNTNHCINVVSTGSHACVYTKSNREKILKEKEENIKDWDTYNCFNSRRYGYYTPVCYQLFPETENSKNWGYETFLFSILAIIPKKIFKWLNLDTQVEPGYSFFYLFSNIMFYIVLFIIFYTIYRVLNYFAKINKRVKGKG
jgi:hypothetical protein